MEIFIFILLAASSSSFGDQDIKILKPTFDFLNFHKNQHFKFCTFLSCQQSASITFLKAISRNYKCFAMAGQNIIDLSFKERQLFILDMACQSSMNTLIQANELNLLYSESIWLLLNNPNIKIFEILELSIAAEIYTIQQVDSKTLQLTEIYARNPDNTKIIQNVISWDSKSDLTKLTLGSISARRQDLCGHKFKAAIVITDKTSLKHVDDLVGTHIDSLSKVNYVMVSLVAVGLNASVDFIITRSWGSKVNGTFDGMIGLVQNGEADLAVTQSFPTEERMDVLDYIDKAVKTRVGFLLISPPLSFSNNIYILPFSINVWLCFIGILILTMPMLYYSSKVENGKQKPERARAFKTNRSYYNPRANREREIYSCSDVALIGLASVCQQGSHIVDPVGIAGRMVILTLYISYIFIYVSYSAYIVILLQSSDKSITTLKDLLESNLDLGVHDISYNRYYFKAATDPVRKAIYKKITPENKPDHFVTMEEGIKKVKSGLYAFQVEKSPGYQLVKKIFAKEEKCGLQELKESFTPDIDPMLGIAKRSPYSEVLKMMFKRLHERGIAHRIGTRLYTKKPSCSQNRMSYVSVGLINTRHAFQFLLCAMLMSWIILTLEILLRKKGRSRFWGGNKIKLAF